MLNFNGKSAFLNATFNIGSDSVRQSIGKPIRLKSL